MQNPLCLPLVHIKHYVHIMWINLDDKLVCVLYIAVHSALQCTYYVNPE